MNQKYESMLCAKDAASLAALWREFIAEASNVKARLEEIIRQCEQEQSDAVSAS